MGSGDPRVDVVVKAEPTPLMRHARSFGCTTLGGYAMMAGQIDAALAFLEGRT